MTPSVGIAPASVFLVAELVGGDAHEDFYCPEVEWEFPDGSRSLRQQDCEPFGEDSALERRFTLRRVLALRGDAEVKVRLRRKARVVAEAEAKVVLH